MKLFISTWSLLVLGCFVFSLIKAAPEASREKRSVHQELCQTNMTVADCQAYAEQKSREKANCHRYYVSGLHIEWQECGRAFCGENTRLVEEDLSKSYPDCCERCEIIDPSKPGKWSATGK